MTNKRPNDVQQPMQDDSAPTQDRNVVTRPSRPGNPADEKPTAESALAVAIKLGLTEPELRAFLEAQEVTPQMVKGLARVSPVAIAAAYPPELVDELVAPASSIKLKETHRERLAEAAARARISASVEAKLSAGAERIDHAARKDADLLDTIAHLAMPQIVAQAAVDDRVTQQFDALIAYWGQRYPGGPRKSSKPSAQAKPTGPATPSTK